MSLRQQLAEAKATITGAQSELLVLRQSEVQLRQVRPGQGRLHMTLFVVEFVGQLLCAQWL